MLGQKRQLVSQLLAFATDKTKYRSGNLQYQELWDFLQS